MAIAQISSWLVGSNNYAASRSLYDHYGDNALLKALFASGAWDYHFSRPQEASYERFQKDYANTMLDGNRAL